MAWHTTSSAERGYGYEWRKQRRNAIRRDIGLCVPCLKQGRTAAFDAVDHIKPRSQGGTDALANLQCICRPCHDFKTHAESTGKGLTPIGLDGWPVCPCPRPCSYAGTPRQSPPGTTRRRRSAATSSGSTRRTRTAIRN